MVSDPLEVKEINKPTRGKDRAQVSFSTISEQVVTLTPMVQW